MRSKIGFIDRAFPKNSQWNYCHTNLFQVQNFSTYSILYGKPL
jgi:hypothetical protein